MGILIYISLWYMIGVGSMHLLQKWINGHQSGNGMDVYSYRDSLVGDKEVWVLGICGVLVPLLMIYMYLAVLYHERKSK